MDFLTSSIQFFYPLSQGFCAQQGEHVHVTGDTHKSLLVLELSPGFDGGYPSIPSQSLNLSDLYSVRPRLQWSNRHGTTTSLLVVKGNGTTPVGLDPKSFVSISRIF